MTQQDWYVRRAKGKGKRASPAPSAQSIIRLIYLEDGRVVPVEPDGMVDIALRELGAKVIDVERIKLDET